MTGLFILLALLSALLDTSRGNDFNLCDLRHDSERGFVDEETGTHFFWNLCSPTERPSACNDTAAAICAFKINGQTKELSPWIKNGGLFSEMTIEKVNSFHTSVVLKGGEPCTLGGKNESYATTFDMLCDRNSLFEDLKDNLKRVEAGQACHLKFFWFTSIACDYESAHSSLKGGACSVSVDDYSQKLYLRALSRDTFYQVEGRNADGKNTTFQLNICNAVKSGACSDGWPFCWIEKDGRPAERHDAPNFTVASYFERGNHAIILTYETGPTVQNGPFKAEFSIFCDENARSNDIRHLDSKWEGKKSVFKFSVKSPQVCLYKPDHCGVKSGKSNFQLLPLATTDYVFHTVDSSNPGLKFFVSVCKPLSPSSLQSKCLDPRTAICMYNASSLSYKTIATFAPNALSRHELDDSLNLNFSNGEVCKGNKRFSSKILFTCAESEGGPSLFEIIDDCDFLFTWSSRIACETSISFFTSRTCKFVDPFEGHEYDFRPLYNARKDYSVMSDSGSRFDINVCGANQLACGKNESGVSICRDAINSNKTVIGFTSSMILHFVNSRMTMEFVGEPCIYGGNFRTTVSFVCDKKTGVGRPEIVSEEGCSLQILWWTSHACKPSGDLPCVTTGKNGKRYDLRDLSLNKDNYELSLKDDSNVMRTRVILNVCRNIVPDSSHDCPPDSAACIATSSVGNKKTEVFESIGGLQKDFQFDDHGRLILEYTIGSLCPDLHSTKQYHETKIIFSCSENVYQSEPRFIEFIDCTYIFFWETAAACEVKFRFGLDKQPGCKILSGTNGHLFDISKLNLTKNLEIRDDSGNTIFLNLCAPLRNKGPKLNSCGFKSGSCLLDPTGRAFNLGDADDSLAWSSTGELTLRYSAPSGNQTVMRFRCGRIKDETIGILIERSSSITLIDVISSMACDHTVYCQARSRSKTVSLFAFMNYEDNFKVKHKNDTFLLSVCKPLKQSGNISCSPGSAVCMSGKNQAKRSYGRAISSPTFNADGDIEIHYQNGSQCVESPQRKYESKIIFICSQNTFPGQVELDLENQDKCLKKFVWKTNLICPSTVSIGEDQCKVSIPSSGLRIDLADIQNTSDHADHIIDSNGRQYYLQSCARYSRVCSSSICVRDSTDPETILSFGSVSNSRYDVTTQSLILEFKSKKICEEQTFHTSEIRFRCPPILNYTSQSPKLTSSFPCHTIFTWETHLICAEPKEKAVVIYLPSRSSNASLAGGLIFFFALVLIAIILVCKKRRVRDRAVQRVIDYSERTASFFGKFTRKRPSGTSSSMGNQVQIFGNLNLDDDEELIIA